ncbi:phage tail tape measure protein [Halomonas alkaliantarctica]|uniref:Phage tail tape measure protein n=1 Tax=Halomonas alkaliantarctica TaxID=232346 RepID=A0ABY8LGM9_9GAMM|nr:phage tail tape measure protein [Halomonas alkaliantarctica]WGI23626.1 phage tail tape measure protein [Halomonas alkaliantarctica]
MADLERSVAIIFEGVDQMGAGVDSATKRLDSIVGSAQGVVDPIANATAGILKFEAALLAGGAAATALAVKMAGDFDAQFKEATTLVDDTGESLDKLRGDLLAYGRDSTQSYEQINASVYGAISAGVEYTQSLDAVRQAEQLAVAGKGELDSSLTVLVSSLNAYGEGMESAQRFSDQLFTTVKNGQTTLPELGGSLANVTGMAASAGVGFDELLASIATLTATGSPTSEAITQIRGAISAILKPTKEASTVAGELGIEFSAAALESEGLQGVLVDVAEATGGNTEKMAQLFGGVEALNGVLTLTGLGAESFSENITAMANSAGATEVAYAKMADTVENNNQRISNAFQSLLITIGNPLLDEFGGIQQAIAAIFNSIGASVSDGQLQQFVDLIEGVMGSLEQSLLNAAENLPDALEAADLSGFVGGFEAVRDAVAGLFDNADLSTAEGLASVIETLGSGVNLLGEFTAGAIEQLVPFMETLAELAQWVTQLGPDVVALGGAIGGVGVAASSILAGIGGLLTILQALGGSSGALPVATRAIGGFVTSLGKIAGPAGAAWLAYSAIDDLMGKVNEFNEQPITLASKIEQDLADVENLQGDEFSLFNVENLLAGYESLRQHFGWGEEAAADFAIVGTEAEAAAVAVASAAQRMGGESSDNIKRLSDAAIETAIAVANASNQLRDGLAAIDSPLVDQIADLPGTLSDAAVALSSGEASIVATSEEIRDALTRVQDAFNQGDIDEQQYRSLTGALLELKESSEQAAQGQEALTGEVLSSEDAILKARQAVLDQTLALEELASNERIKNMEFAVDFKIAQMEADAKKVEAILNATSTTISSTAEAAASMFETLGGGELSFGDRWLARDAIEQQLQIQEQAANQQGQLIEAQVEQMRARTQALQSGDGLIKISSDGLEPALEMIMWQVLEKIQMRANAEGAEFLLGL